jgi:sterol desaturase/sphingolipid hydroxylase (fatty acid hydroxylase superfamily)
VDFIEAGRQVREAWDALGLAPFEKGLVKVGLLTLGLFALVWAIERASGTRTAHYRSRAFLHDLAFWFYYRLGLHDLLFMSAIVLALEPLVAPHALDLMVGRPFVLQALAYIVVGDFIAYWVHRAEHRYAWMWAFHTTHHSQAQLTFATTARFHPVEMIYHTLLAYLPLRLLGVQPMVWLPMFLAMQVFTAVQHTQIPWRLGPFYRLLATPGFHAYHHSADPAHHDRNFGNMLSLWDHLFGTAVAADAPRPVRFGLGGTPPATLGAILLQPFRLLLRRGDAPLRAPVDAVGELPRTPH